MNIDDIAQTIVGQARSGFDMVANSRGRSGRHIAVGFGLTAGAVLLSWAIARRGAPAADPGAAADLARLDKPARTASAFAALWPSLYIALTLSGLRIWNAPPGPARTRALGLWSLVQGLNAVWIGMGFRRLGGRLAAACASLGASLAYGWQAGKVDALSARMVAPYLGWVGMAGVLSEELWRRNSPPPTIH